MDGLFRGMGEASLGAALELLGSEERAIIRLSDEGRIIALTAHAAEAVGLGPLELIFCRMQAVQRGLLREALKEKKPCGFSEYFCGGRLYDVTTVPTEEGALMLLSMREEQTLLDAKLQNDIRNSLQGISSAVSLIQATHPSLYATIMNRMYRIERSIDHAALLKQPPGGYERPYFVMRDLAELCREAAEHFMEAGGPPVEVSAPPRILAPFDPQLLMRALLNLLTNAAFTTRIKISAACRRGDDFSDDMYLITVEDNGDGLPEEELHFLYNSWRETVNLRRYPVVYEGEKRPGIGLPVVQLIAELHRGRLLFEQTSQGGARFCFSFPGGLSDGPVFEVHMFNDQDDISIVSIVRSELSVLENQQDADRQGSPLPSV